MLLRKATLDAIVSGDVDLAFRKWSRPTVKAGGTIRTRAGRLQIRDVGVVPVEGITERDAARAGTGLDDLRSLLESRSDGEVYRIEFGTVHPDPLVALRDDDDLSAEELDEIASRIGRLDRDEPWVLGYLELIGAHPHVRAEDLAEGLGLEKQAFKTNVRKLKALGLTISHSPGYELSPRGRRVLKYLRERFA